MRFFNRTGAFGILLTVWFVQFASAQEVWESPRRLSEDQRKKALAELLKWGKAGQFEVGLVNLFDKLDFSGKPDPYSIRSVAPNVGEYWLKVQTPKEFIGKFANPNEALCVQVRGLGDDLGQVLPLPAVQFLADSFSAGFVCRMMLAHAIESQAIDSVGLNLEVQSALTSEQLTKLGRYTNPKEYGYRARSGRNPEVRVSPESFRKGVASLLRQESITAYGLLMGWRAASELDKVKKADPNYWDAASTLVGSRYSPEQLGSMTSFALTYIAGFSAATAKKVRADDSASVLEGISSESKESMPQAVALTRNLYQAFHTEYSKLLKAEQLQLDDNINSRLTSERSDNLINAYSQFLAGLQTGASTAAYLIFKEAYAMGYSMGYQDGFRDGYSAGYAAGSKDGFARGQDAANKELRAKLADLGTKLVAANAGVGGVAGKLETAGKVINKVVKVGRSVAKFFGF